MVRQPEGPPPPPVVQRLRVRYAKRGLLRFTPHRDFARAFERALRRAGVRIGYSAGLPADPELPHARAARPGLPPEAERRPGAAAAPHAAAGLRRGLPPPG